jgi:spore coat polysaccharide biosynthesis predicted glycosyltransferase SpsG
MVVLAQNQQKVARELEAAAAVILLASIENIQSVLPGLLQEVLKDGAALRSLSATAARITDGLGMQAVLGYLEQFDGES